MGRHVSQKTYRQTMQLASVGRKPKEILLISLEISRTLGKKIGEPLLSKGTKQQNPYFWKVTS